MTGTPTKMTMGRSRIREKGPGLGGQCQMQHPRAVVGPGGAPPLGSPRGTAMAATAWPPLPAVPGLALTWASPGVPRPLPAAPPRYLTMTLVPTGFCTTPCWDPCPTAPHPTPGAPHLLASPAPALAPAGPCCSACLCF